MNVFVSRTGVFLFQAGVTFSDSAGHPMPMGATQAATTLKPNGNRTGSHMDNSLTTARAATLKTAQADTLKTTQVATSKTARELHGRPH